MELELTPNILETPSLSTPTIPSDPVVFRSSYASEDKSAVETPSTVKLSKIKNDLKQTFSQARQPTESPFQKMAEAGLLPVAKQLTTDDGLPVEVPSTAEVMNVIESLTKSSTKESSEREATAASDNLQLDSAMGLIVSPKKKLLYRSQSQTDGTSMANDEILLDEQQFQRLNDIPLLDSAVLQPMPTNKGQKRPVHPSHEVTSSIPTLPPTKRQKLFPAPTTTIPTRAASNGDSLGSGDDQRKQQIRDSNREAARRCRERRRNYIEQLEGDLERYKAEIKQLNEQLLRAERDNTQLRTIIAETKLFQFAREPTIATE